MGVWSWFGYPSDLGGIFVVIFDFSRTSLHFDQISVGFGLDFRERGGILVGFRSELGRILVGLRSWILVVFWLGF